MWPFRQRKAIVLEPAGGPMTLAEQYIDEFPYLTTHEILCVHTLRVIGGERLRSQQGGTAAPTSSDVPETGGGAARE